jgi:hypothetical protein
MRREEKKKSKKKYKLDEGFHPFDTKKKTPPVPLLKL